MNCPTTSRCCWNSPRPSTKSAGYQLLCRHRTPIDLLHAGLAKAGSPYAGVISAVSRTLPPATVADLQEARRLAMQGPPAESVGLEPFALTIRRRSRSGTALRWAPR